MEVENISSSTITATNNNTNYEEEEDDIPLPGFRFHPTDEELVGFYLRRKIEKKPMRIELIKQADIYRYDPWDLPKSGDVGEKEWYFFCKRGRKYRNSTRPNRVTGTGSGFWKATGIDRPIYSSGNSCIIGLKKSLVYYRGSAGKGTKTDWMMHEFRLPSSNNEGGKITDHVVTKNFAHQEAEVWTICRILKRNVTYKKCVPNWREIQIAAASASASAKRNTMLINNNNNSPIFDQNYSRITCSIDSSDQNRQISNYISFINTQSNNNIPNNYQQRQFSGHNFPSSASSFASRSNLCAKDVSDEFLRSADCEDLRTIVDCVAVANPFYL